MYVFLRNEYISLSITFLVQYLTKCNSLQAMKNAHYNQYTESTSNNHLRLGDLALESDFFNYLPNTFPRYCLTKKYPHLLLPVLYCDIILQHLFSFLLLINHSNFCLLINELSYEKSRESNLLGLYHGACLFL